MSSSSQQQSPLFDGRFIMTMVAVLAIWLGWQSYMARKYPDSFKKPGTHPATSQEKMSETVGSNKETSGSITEPSAPETKLQGQPVAPERVVTYEDNNWSFKISSNGMAVSDVVLKNYTDRSRHPVRFAVNREDSLFGTGLLGRRDLIQFQLRQTSETEFVGEASVEGMKITKVLHVDSSRYLIETKLKVEQVTSSFTGLVTRFSDRLQKYESGSFLIPSFEHQEFYSYSDGSSDRVMVPPNDGESIIETFSKTKIAAFGSQYFAVAVIDRSPIMPEFKAITVPDKEIKVDASERGQAVGTLTHALLNKAESFYLDYTAFVGPKSLDLLKAVDADMMGLVNLGFFTSIAKGILWLMKTIYSVIGNWGVAIIFLTIIVRILVLPFNLMGYKQMKAMAKIQPEIKILREKYKNDQQRLNQEMMRLMKEAKANPLGGCLPMFLQIPVFFALYQVIGQSIELYQAPFVFWIQDLSSKDPYYALPVLMGVTMYLQQKMTPTNLEPAQKKVMMFLPVIFAFFMISLPSGLTLYITVSSIFGVIQQIYFMKNNDDSKPVASAGR